MTRAKGRAPSQRQLRVGEEVRHALSQVLTRGELRDPALVGRSITVTEVRISPDLRAATVFVVPLGEDGEGALVKGLERSAPYLRGRVNEAVHLKHSPRLTFALDTTFAAARRIDEVLHRPDVVRDLGPDEGGGGDGA